MVFVGAESGSTDTLERMNKGGTASAELTLDLARRAKSYGVVPEFSFVVGNPPDPEGDLRHTLGVHPPGEIDQSGGRDHPLRQHARPGLRVSADARRVGERSVADVFAASRSENPVVAAGRSPPRPRFRDRDERVLPDGHRCEVDALEAMAAPRVGGVALPLACQQLAGRVARVAAGVPVSETGDDGLLVPACRAGLVAPPAGAEGPPQLMMKLLKPGGAIREAYAAWAPHYPPLAHNALMQVEERAVLALLPPVTGLVALDAACGTGRYLRVLEERGARRVFGVDNSPADDRARRRRRGAWRSARLACPDGQHRRDRVGPRDERRLRSRRCAA